MKKYWIKDETGLYWSRSGYFGYWSKLEDKVSVENRVKYNLVSARIQMLLMSIFAPEIKKGLIEVRGTKK